MVTEWLCRLQHVQAHALCHAYRSPHMLDDHPIWECKQSLLCRQDVAGWTQEKLHIANISSFPYSSRRRSNLSFQRRFPTCFKLIHILELLPVALHMVKEQTLLPVDLSRFLLRFHQTTQYGSCFRRCQCPRLPSIPHTRNGWSVAKGKRWPLHLGQRLQSVLQVVNRKLGHAWIQLL